jgi:hypothetical protein
VALSAIFVKHTPATVPSKISPPLTNLRRCGTASSAAAPPTVSVVVTEA